MPPVPGERITVAALLGGCATLLSGTVRGIARAPTGVGEWMEVDIPTLRPAQSHTYTLNYEGISWIRGQHALGSAEADALLAAYALIL